LGGFRNTRLVVISTSDVFIFGDEEFVFVYLVILVVGFSVFNSFYFLLEVFLISCIVVMIDFILLVREEILFFLWMIELLMEFGVVVLVYNHKLTVRRREIVQHHSVAGTCR
jgi:hypothetical protein